jgi:hypothetical protein
MKENKAFDTKTLLKRMLGRKPKTGEEDFWVFSVVTDDPATPTWERRIQVVGTYNQNCQAAARIIDLILRTGVSKRGLRIESYQGEKARALLAETQAQDAAYRQERSAQANN